MFRRTPLPDLWRIFCMQKRMGDYEPLSSGGSSELTGAWTTWWLWGCWKVVTVYTLKVEREKSLRKWMGRVRKHRIGDDPEVFCRTGRTGLPLTEMGASGRSSVDRENLGVLF